MQTIKTIDKEFYSSLSNELNRKRREKGMSLRRIAKRTGKSYQAIDNYFLGRTKMSDDVFAQLCRILDFEPNLQVKVRIE